MRIFAFADESAQNIDGQIDAMKRNGLNGLEIRNVDAQNIVDMPAEKISEVHKKLDDAGLMTWSIGSPIGKIDIETGDFPKELERLKYIVEAAKILGAENIRMFSFYIPKDKKPEDYKNEVIDRLGIMLQTVKGSGVQLCHENEKGIYGDVAPRCREILDALPEMQGIFDPANFIQCHQDTIEGWEMLKSRIKYMHIKDCLEDGSVVPAGAGVGNLAVILKDFISLGGNEVTIEPHLTVFKGFEDLEPADKKSAIKSFRYPNGAAAFDVACNELKKII